LQNINNGGNEYAIDFWVYIYTYLGGTTFTGADIIWDKNIRIQLGYTGSTLQSYCYPYVDASNLPAYSFKATYTIQEGKWVYIQCIVNFNLNEIYFNTKTSVAITEARPTPVSSSTMLKIKDNSLNENYGVFFLREIKMWTGQYNFLLDIARM